MTTTAARRPRAHHRRWCWVWVCAALCACGEPARSAPAPANNATAADASSDAPAPDAPGDDAADDAASDDAAADTAPDDADTAFDDADAAPDDAADAAPDDVDADAAPDDVDAAADAAPDASDDDADTQDAPPDITAPPGELALLQGGCLRDTPEGFTCAAYEVRCPDTEPVRLELATRGEGRLGTVLLGSGSVGEGFFGKDAARPSGQAARALAERGYRVILRGWGGDGGARSGWFGGTDAGLVAASCRYATLTWALAQTHADGPLCVAGNSGGAAEIGLALNRWGIGDWVAQAVLMSGPLGDLEGSCRGTSPGWDAFCAAEQPNFACGAQGVSCLLADEIVGFIDLAYGRAACSGDDPSDATLLRRDSPLSDDARVDHPNTRIDAVLGARDCGGVATSGRSYLARVTDRDGAIDLVWLPEGRHGLHDTPDGAALLEDLIADGCRAP